MNIGVCDIDFAVRPKHRFPNLACMKLSAAFKSKGCNVKLIKTADGLVDCDKVIASKVFTDTDVPDWLPADAHKGGTGFFFDKAPAMPDSIEHIMPDYHLYDAYIDDSPSFKEYRDYSIGYLTRGCFRKCKFCVNQKYSRVFPHSPLEEFFDKSRKKICMLDDNFFGYPHWKQLLQQLIDTGRPFKFKQGLDERLLTEEKCEMLFSAKYDGDYTFAFDNVNDYDLIESKLKMIRKYTDRTGIKFYVLCGFPTVGVQDILDTFKRIELLKRYRCYPYIMRYQSKDDAPYKHSEWASFYNLIARWCNQPRFFWKTTLKQFAEFSQQYTKSECAPVRMVKKWENEVGELTV